MLRQNTHSFINQIYPLIRVHNFNFILRQVGTCLCFTAIFTKGNIFYDSFFFVPWMIKLFNPIALRKAKTAYSFGLSECNKVKRDLLLEERICS